MKRLVTAALFCGFLFSANGQTWNPDADFNNLIGLNDLLSLLTVYGNEWTIDAGPDSQFDIAAYYAGEMDLPQCIRTCRTNNAAVISFEEFALFEDSINLAVGLDLPDDTCSGYEFNVYFNHYRYISCRDYSASGFSRMRVGGSVNCYDQEVQSYNKNIDFQYYSYFAPTHCICSGLVPSSE